MRSTHPNHLTTFSHTPLTKLPGRESFYPTYYSAGASSGTGIQVETIAFFAEETGIHTVEIEGVSTGDTQFAGLSHTFETAPSGLKGAVINRAL